MTHGLSQGPPRAALVNFSPGVHAPPFCLLSSTESRDHRGSTLKAPFFHPPKTFPSVLFDGPEPDRLPPRIEDLSFGPKENFPRVFPILSCLLATLPERCSASPRSLFIESVMGAPHSPPRPVDPFPEPFRFSGPFSSDFPSPNG